MELLESFERDLTIRRRSVRTVQGYSKIITKFLEYFPEPEKVDSDMLEEYLEHLMQRNLRGTTLKNVFSGISSVYDYLEWKKMVNRNPVPNFRKRYLDNTEESERRQVPELWQVRELIKRLDTILELTIVMVFAKTGIRREELLLLKPEDIDLENRIIVIERKKRARNRIRSIDDELYIVLTRYLKWREERANIGKCKSQYLFINEYGSRIHKDSINMFIQDHAEEIGFHERGGPLEKQMSSHCFRGFLTTQLRRAGMKKEHIQTMLGHSLNNEVWSGHYLGIDMGIVREEYLQCVSEIII